MPQLPQGSVYIGHLIIYCFCCINLYINNINMQLCVNRKFKLIADETRVLSGKIRHRLVNDGANNAFQKLNNWLIVML